jgi:hypothetical protein
LESKIISSFDYKILYNLTLNSATNKGLKHSAESKLRMKKLRIERGHPLEKPVYVYDKDLKFIGRYNSLADTARATGAERNVISGYLGTDKV